MEFQADLHVHSTASDGTLSPSKVVEEAARLNLGAIALTDHDSLAGIAAARANGSHLGVEVIGGVELSTEWSGEEVHVLGYFIEPGGGDVEALLERLREARLERARRMLERLKQLGLAISWSEVKRQAGQGAVGRPHIARALVSAGYVNSVEEAFERYLNRGCPAYVPRYKLTPAQAVELIHTGGGVAVLAHPGLISAPARVAELLAFGFRGVEVFHPDHTPEVTGALLAIARDNGLAITGGSDFHGPKRRQGRLGQCVVSLESVLDLKNRC